MKSKLFSLLAVVVLACSLSGCGAVTPGDVGLVGGAAAGGLLGYGLTGGSTLGTVVGAAGGALVGKAIAGP